MYICTCECNNYGQDVHVYTCTYIEDEAKIMSREVISVVKSLRHKEEMKEKNPLIRLISIFNGNSVFYKAKFVELNSIFVIPFLHHHGVYYLCQALEGNKNEQFIEHALS